MNLLIEHRIKIPKIKAAEYLAQFAIGPVAIEMTLRHPGEKRLRALISALNRST
jgi:hypothetical protein